MKKSLKIWPALLLAAGVFTVTVAATPVTVNSLEKLKEAVTNKSEEISFTAFNGFVLIR